MNLLNIYFSNIERMLLMIKVKMNVQSAYYGELLRKGKIYEIEKKTAQRWIDSNIAQRIEQINQTEPSD